MIAIQSWKIGFIIKYVACCGACYEKPNLGGNIILMERVRKNVCLMLIEEEVNAILDYYSWLKLKVFIKLKNVQYGNEIL